jgi:uncharacterized surface protein with fasciclin (FAS1) repeats
MHRATIEEIKKFTPAPKHPSLSATPIVAMVLAGIVGATAVYANYARGNLFEELDKDYRVNDFEQVVSNTTLKDSFAEESWEYTIIAPTDQAFDKAQWQKEQAILTHISAKPEQPVNTIEPGYSDISAYDYVTSTPIYPNDIAFGEHIRIPSLSGNDIVFSRVRAGTEGLRVNGQPVTHIHYANNGVIYVIDDMISFPELQQQFSWAQ